jgi:uncharacterized protein YdaU (DUF1376 family)
MSDDPPYMPLYFGDVLKLTLYWTGEERALLVLLLAVQWWHGALPFDLSSLANAIGYDESAFLELWNRRVHTVFDERDDGFVHEETESRRRNLAKMSGARRAAGQASGRARRARAIPQATEAEGIKQTRSTVFEQNSERAVRTKTRTNGSGFARTSIQSNPIQSSPDQKPSLSDSPTAEAEITLPPLPSGADPPPSATAPKAENGNGRLPRRRRLPADYATEQWRVWAEEHTPRVNFDSEIAMLRDHEFRDTHSDWDAVVRNWLRRAAKETKRDPAERLTSYERHKRRLYGEQG